MGGVAGALARHAERALAEMSVDERRIARRVLLQLVSGKTRRTVARERLVDMLGRTVDPVLDRLIATRLVVQRGAVDGDAASVEIAHESLLQTWEQLARWIEESREERRVLDELEVAASLWERRGKRLDETWSQADLAAVRHRAAQLEIVLPAHVEAFLSVGEARHRRAQRRRRIRLGIVVTAACAAGGGAFVLVGRYLAREHLIQTNAGTVDLVLAPFDLNDGAPRPVAAADVPQLAWTLYAARPDDPHEPGDPVPPQVVDVLDQWSLGTQRVWRVRAPGGTAFLRIDGRGRDGEHCSPSWIRIRAFPGYATTSTIESFQLPIPTCQASHAQTVAIESGPFIYGGPSEQPSRSFDHPDYHDDDELPTPARRLGAREWEVPLPRFEIDRTEVSNAAFSTFARLEKITGYPAPVYSNDSVHGHDSDPAYPVTEVDAYEAKAYCRWLGKRLPGDLQWVKAARGGVRVHGITNPWPRRLYPWGPELDPHCVNQAGEQDGYRWIAPVESFPCGASPYGVLNLAGNVQEWIDRDGQIDWTNPLHAMRGGAADSEVEREQVTTIFKNHRDPRRFDYSVGFRCVYVSEENKP